MKRETKKKENTRVRDNIKWKSFLPPQYPKC